MKCPKCGKEIMVDVESWMGRLWLYETCKAEVLKETDQFYLVKILDGLCKGVRAVALKGSLKYSDRPFVPYDFKEWWLDWDKVVEVAERGES